MHHQVVKKVKEVIVSRFEVSCLFCDEVITIYNQLWVSIHCYTFVVNWCHILILISLEQVIEAGGSNNLTKVVMGALKKHGVFAIGKLISFGVDGVNVLQGVCDNVTHQIQDRYFPIWKAYITWHIALT
jgi:hypothetical protein